MKISGFFKTVLNGIGIVLLFLGATSLGGVVRELVFIARLYGEVDGARAAFSVVGGLLLMVLLGGLGIVLMLNMQRKTVRILSWSFAIFWIVGGLIAGGFTPPH